MAGSSDSVRVEIDKGVDMTAKPVIECQSVDDKVYRHTQETSYA